MYRFLRFIYAERPPTHSDVRPHVRVLVRLINCQVSLCRYIVEVSFEFSTNDKVRSYIYRLCGDGSSVEP
jgi:hypothetical protein